MELGLAGQALARVLVNLDISLEFESGDSVELSSFSIVASFKSPAPNVNVEYQNTAQGLAAVTPLVGRRCIAAECDDSGALTVVFEGGVSISAPPSDGESWELRGADGRIVISGPGGTLSTWS